MSSVLSTLAVNKRVLVLVECLQGRGEITQCFQLVKKLLAKGIQVAVATSSGVRDFSALKSTDGVFGANLEIVELPPILFDKEEGEYYVTPHAPLYAKGGGYSEAGNLVIQERSRLICASAKGSYSIILASGWPLWLGEGILDVEMQELLRAHAEKNIFVVTREVICADSPVISGGDKAIIELFNSNPNVKWLVLGDDRFLPLEASLPVVDKIDPTKIHYVGYGASHPGSSDREFNAIDKVVVSGGGGDFRHSSFNLIRAVIASAAGSELKDREWMVIVGRNYPEHKKAELQALVDSQAELINIRLVSEMQFCEYTELLRAGALFIGHAGIGATNDIIASNLRSLLLPISSDINTRMLDGTICTFHFNEQYVRVKKLSESGLVATVNFDSNALNTETLETDRNLVDALRSGIGMASRLNPSFEGIKCDGFEVASNIVIDALLKEPLERSWVKRSARVAVAPVSKQITARH